MSMRKRFLFVLVSFLSYTSLALAMPEQKLTASDGAEDDWFGRSVSLSGDVALVGAGRDDCTAGICRGSAYVFRKSGSSWTAVGPEPTAP